MIGWLLACSTPPEVVEPEPEPKFQPIQRVEVPIAPGPVGSDGATVTVPIELQFVGVGDLHRGWFSESAIVTELSMALSPCVRERAVVQLTYDQEENLGHIRFITAGRDLTCKPAVAGDQVDLGGLEPIGRALASYRDTVAGRFDFRVASFRVQLEVSERTFGCELQLGGQFPPDGTTWANCPVLGGEPVCAGPERDGSRRWTFEDPKHTRYLGACFEG